MLKNKFTYKKIHHPFLAYTLLETLMTLSLIAILAALSLPPLQLFLTHTQDKILLSQLLSALQLAHLDARTYRLPIAFCNSNHHPICSSEHTPTEALLFIDENETGQVEDEEQILHIIPLLLHQGRLFLRSYPRYRPYLLFLPMGFTQNDNATLWYCHRDNTIAFAIMLSYSGRARISYPDDHGEIKDSKGERLVCHQQS